MAAIPPEHEFYFGVGDPETLMSSVFRIFTWPGKSDVYVAEKGLVESFKASLHQSRKYRIAFSEQFVKTQRDAGHWKRRKRTTDEWTGQEIKPGVLSPLSILVPAGELRPAPGQWTSRTPVMWLSAPPTNHAYEVRLYIWNVSLLTVLPILSPDFQPIGLWARPLADGWQLSVVAKLQLIPSELHKTINDFRERALEVMKRKSPALVASSEPGRFRMLMQARTDDGTREMVDLAIDEVRPDS